jgi:quercetin dioxygenase-like cupin family protein
MKKLRIEDSGERGWFVGLFPEAALMTSLAEVCYTIEKPGQLPKHYHTRCTETLLIISGSCIQNGVKLGPGDITVLEPGEINDSYYLEDSAVIGVKTPAGGDDKVYIE